MRLLYILDLKRDIFPSIKVPWSMLTLLPPGIDSGGGMHIFRQISRSWERNGENTQDTEQRRKHSEKLALHLTVTTCRNRRICFEHAIACSKVALSLETEEQDPNSALAPRKPDRFTCNMQRCMLQLHCFTYCLYVSISAWIRNLHFKCFS